MKRFVVLAAAVLFALASQADARPRFFQRLMPRLQQPAAAKPPASTEAKGASPEKPAVAPDATPQPKPAAKQAAKSAQPAANLSAP